MPWLEQNFDGSHVTATRYMKISDPANIARVKHLAESDPDLSIREALKAAYPCL